ncbi:hypothetical protein GW915_02505 [bacterium]|nr:hypothetical protein [bacterium]
MDFQSFIDSIAAVKSLGITAPCPPDGDSVGAQCALKELIEQLHPHVKVEIINEDPCPKRYEFLKLSDQFKQSKDIKESPEAWLCVDGGPLRSGVETKKLWDKAKIHGLMDHHVVGSKESFHFQLYDPTAAATTEMVYKLAMHCKAKLTPSLAQAIYVGLIYDTGLFKHSNTTPEIMRIGAHLLEVGFNHTETAEKAMLIRSKGSLDLLRLMLNKFNHSDKISWSAITHAEFIESGATGEDKDGLIDVLFLQDKCSVAVLFFEAKPSLWKLSFRSRGPDVASFARSLNPQGGGHKLASGCTLEGDMKTITDKTISSLSKVVS